ncbi:TetR/AcrR family transcriptional regulator [Mycolicibacterium thermoresistibile]
MARPQDPQTGPRAAMLRSAVALMRRQGIAATSFADVLADSGAPRGSIYHHFPAGKAQLVEEATRAAAAHLNDRVAKAFDDAPDMSAALRSLVAVWRDALEAGDYAVGCPIVAAALGTERAARDVAGVAFSQWSGLIADKLVADGLTRRRAQTLAVLIVSAMEGALVLAQAQRDAAALDAVVDELTALCAEPME